MEIFRIVEDTMILFWMFKNYYFKFNKFDCFLRNKEFFVEEKYEWIYKFLRIWISILKFLARNLEENVLFLSFSLTFYFLFTIYLMEEKVCMKYNIVMWKTIELRLPGLRNLYRLKASNWIRGDFYTFYSCP